MSCIIDTLLYRDGVRDALIVSEVMDAMPYIRNRKYDKPVLFSDPLLYAFTDNGLFDVKDDRWEIPTLIPEQWEGGFGVEVISVMWEEIA